MQSDSDASQIERPHVSSSRPLEPSWCHQVASDEPGLLLADV